MSVTNDELQSFYNFALGVIEKDDKTKSLQELVEQWGAQRERESTNEAIRESLEQIENGETKPIGEFLSEMKAKHNLSLKV